MGCRLHKIKTYEVEYEEDARFNWQQCEVLDTLNNYECDMSVVEDANGCDRYEIEEQDYEKFLKDFEADKGAQCKIKDYTPEEVLEWFKSAPRLKNGFVMFQWF